MPLNAYAVPPRNYESVENTVALFPDCYEKITQSDFSDTNYWRCLTGGIWSEVPAVQALSYKILTKLNAESWATEAVESVYLDEALIEWANAKDELEASKVVDKDAFGIV